MLLKLVKLIRRIRILFGDYKGMEEKHKLFRLTEPMLKQVLYKRLIPHCYQYNYASTTYLKQIFTVRKLINSAHQIHLRFYSDNWVSGHYELQPEEDVFGHLKGVDLRELTKEETNQIKKILGVPNDEEN